MPLASGLALSDRLLMAEGCDVDLTMTNATLGAGATLSALSGDSATLDAPGRSADAGTVLADATGAILTIAHETWQSWMTNAGLMLAANNGTLAFGTTCFVCSRGKSGPLTPRLRKSDEDSHAEHDATQHERA
jgi:hypothetical protein